MYNCVPPQRRREGERTACTQADRHRQIWAGGPKTVPYSVNERFGFFMVPRTRVQAHERSSMCECVCERERERDRDIERERERGRETERGACVP
jgi:hypothetical protein